MRVSRSVAIGPGLFELIPGGIFMIKKLSELQPGQLRLLPKNEEVTHEVAAAYVGLSKQALHNKNYTELGPRSFLRFGKRIYLISDLDAWLKKETQEKRAYA